MIDTIILKVASRCNLACTYCYEYAAGDNSWRNKPRLLSFDLAQALGKRIQEYTDCTNSPDSINVVLHGGEPLLAGQVIFSQIVEAIAQSAGSGRVRFHVQTNGILLDESWASLLGRLNVKVGVSLDGDVTANAGRVDHRGHATWERTVQGIENLKRTSPHSFGGLLCVVDTRSDPHAVMKTLLGFSPPLIDLLQPFITHDMRDENSAAIVSQFGEWMIAATEFWLSHPEWHSTRVRYAEDAMKAVAGIKPKSDWFGQRGVTYLIVETDGRYDLQDQLKVIGASSTAFRAMSGSVVDTPIADAYKNARDRADRLKIDLLPTDCELCRWRVGCGGGFAPTRYSEARAFDNPSTYCAGLKKYFGYLEGVLNPHLSRVAQVA